MKTHLRTYELHQRGWPHCTRGASLQRERNYCEQQRGHTEPDTQAFWHGCVGLFPNKTSPTIKRLNTSLARDIKSDERTK